MTERGVCVKIYRNYLFDLYGTLVDVHTDEENDLLWKRLSIFLGTEGVYCTPDQLKQSYFTQVTDREQQARLERGNGAEIDIGPVFERIYRENGFSPSNRQVENLAKLFRIFSTEKLRLFPGTKEMLCRLKTAGKHVYLLSNAQAMFTLPELEALELLQYFDGIVISSNEGMKKPDKGLYQLALERYGLDPQETVMVGNDDQADCWGAAAADLDSMYIFTEQSPRRTTPLPDNCRVLTTIGDVF